jgi:phosphatidylinositol alpha-1,6-mannosyltransferase
MKHLLVTNDFPPKIGGIQSLLWEWWRRLPSDSFAVLTSPYAGSEAFDAEQPFRIERTREPVLLPHPFMVQRINRLAREVGADFVVLDPAVPLGIEPCTSPRVEECPTRHRRRWLSRRGGETRRRCRS